MAGLKIAIMPSLAKPHDTGPNLADVSSLPGPADCTQQCWQSAATHPAQMSAAKREALLRAQRSAVPLGPSQSDAHHRPGRPHDTAHQPAAAHPLSPPAQLFAAKHDALLLPQRSPAPPDGPYRPSRHKHTAA